MRSPRTRTSSVSNRRRAPKNRLRIENLEARVVPASLSIASNALTYTAGAGINNSLSVAISGTNFVFTDTGETITTSISGGSGSGTNSITVPAAGVTGITLDLSNGADAIASGGAVLTTQDLSILHNGTGLSIAGPVTTTTGLLTINNTGTGGVVTTTSTVIVATATFTANTVTGATWASNVATITTSVAHGFSVGQSIPVAGIVPAGYNATVTITSVPTPTTFTYALATNPGTYISGGTAGGRQTLTTSAAHNLLAGQVVTIGNVVPAGYNNNFTIAATPTSTTFQIGVGTTLGNVTTAGTVSNGIISTGTGNISVSSNNALTIAATLGSSGGTLTLKSNQDGVGSDALSQTAGTIVTTNTTTNAVSITANTAGGGTGNVSIDNITVGGTAGGTLTVNSNGGSIVYPGTATLSLGQLGTIGSGTPPGIPGGSAPTRVLAARDYNFTATGTGSIGTTTRPMQISNFGTDGVNGGSNFTLNGGDGGVYWTKWSGVDGTLAGASATGAGNIRVAAANVGGNNLFISGNVAAVSGNIFLAADDNFVINPNVAIGGAGFSGTVWIQGNRDQGTAGQPLTMGAGSSIVTTSTANVSGTPSPTTQAIYLDISGDAGTPSPITLGTLKAGNGAKIVVNAIPNGIAAEAGTIAMADSTSIVDAGATGTIVLTAGITDTANSPALSAIGTPTVPIRVAGGNVVIASNLGNVVVSSTATASITATMTATSGQSASAPASITLSTTAGALTIPAALANVRGGAINLSGAGGVVLNAQLGGAATGAIGISGPLTGSSNIVTGTGAVTISQDANSTYTGVIGGNQGIVKSGTGTLTFSTPQTFAGIATASGGILNLGANLTGAGGANVAAGGTLTNTTGAIAGPVSVSGTLSPGGTAVAGLGTGNLSFGSGGVLAVNLNGVTTPGTDFDQLAVTGNANVDNGFVRVLVGASPTLSVGQQFAIVTATGTVSGQFTNGTTITAADNPLYKFTPTIVGGNQLVLTLAFIQPPRYLDLVGGNTLSYSTSASIDSTVSVSVSNGNYTVNEAAGPIALSTTAAAAGWTGDGTNSVTGPVAGITTLAMDLADGNDTITGLDGGNAAVTLNSVATLTTSGTVTTNGNVAFTNAPTLNLGGTISPTGTVTTPSVLTVNLTGTVSPGTAANLVATDITAGASSLLSSPTVNLTAINSIGTSSNRIKTQANTIVASAGAGGVFLAEADGATVTATATGTGKIDIVNAAGTLNLKATTAAGDIVASETVGTLNITSATISTSGNIALSSGDAIGIDANLTASAGTIAIAANTDGAGSEGFAQTAGLISTGNTGTSAATIMVNTAGGGTGDVSIDSMTIGGASGGRLTINSNGGNILYAGAGALDAFQQGLQGNGGTAPTRILKAASYNFTATGSGSVGNDSRPMQSDNFNATNSGDFSAGTGGIFWTDWGSTAFNIANAKATGAGNIRIVTANAAGHNLIVGPTGLGSVTTVVTTGSGTIVLAADDDFVLSGNAVIGDSGFSGTVDLEMNRDTGNGQSLLMFGGSAIVTSNSSTSAVTLIGYSGGGSAGAASGISAGLGGGGISLSNITTGAGATISINAAGGTATAREGSIVQLAGTLLNAGTTGKVVLNARAFDPSGGSNGTATYGQGNIGIGGTAVAPIALPIHAKAGTIIATTSGTTLGNTGGINVFDAVDGSFTATTIGNATGAISLATDAGVLTLAGTSSTAGGPLKLTSTTLGGGVALNGTLSATTGNITINAGSNQATLNSTLNLNSNQTLTVNASNGLVVTASGILTGTGAAANATPITVQTDGTVSPADTGIGILNVGSTSIAPGGNLHIDIIGGTGYDTLNVHGAIDVANAILDVSVAGILNVGDSFTVLTNDGGDAVTGQFVGVTTINASNDPRYVFTINYAGGDGNDVVATISNFVSGSVLDINPNGRVTLASADALDNSVSVNLIGASYSITDTAGIITLTQAAITAGWTGDGSQTVVGPFNGVNRMLFALNSGNDTLNAVNVGSIPLEVTGSGMLNVAGVVATNGDITISGETSIAGVGTLQASTVNLAASNSIGSFSQRLATNAGSIVASVGTGGLYLSEADGANLTATATGQGIIDVLNGTGTLNIAGATSTVNGNIVLASGDGVSLSANVNAGTGTIAIAANTDGAGAQGFDQKNGSLTTTNATTSAATINVNTASGGTGDAIIGLGSVGNNSGGAITVASNGGNILWSNDPSYAAFTTAQTGLSSGGNNAQTLRAYAYNLTTTASAGSIGTNARPLQFDNYGTNEAAASDVNLTASAGTGGIFTTVWGVANNDFTTGTVTAQGAANIRIVTANSGGHNLWVADPVSTGSGTISLYADDELTITGTGLVGGAGFSGLVDIIGNRDAGNGQSANMQFGSAIVTSNATANAVSILALSGGNNASTGLSDLTPQGGVVLTNVTVGDGGTVTVNAAAGGGAARQGTIVQRNNTLVDAGPNGTVVLLARANDTTSTTNPLNAGNIGANGDIANLTLLPITVRAGTVTATTNGTNLGNTGVIDVIDTIAGKFTAVTTGNATAKMILATSAGALTIVGATNTGGGAITLTGQDGVVLNATLGGGTSGAIAVNGPLSGNADITLGTGGLTVTQTTDSLYAGIVSGSQGLTKVGTGTLTLAGNNTYSAGTTVSEGGLLAGNSAGSATGAGSVTVADGATIGGSGVISGTTIVSGNLAPGGTGNGTGALNMGNLAFGASGVRTVAIDLNGLAAGTGYDQLDVPGTIDLTGATLLPSAASGFRPLLGATFTILKVDGTLNGTFASLAQDATFDVDNRTYQISYVGGDGNDVTLKVVHITSGPPVNTVPGDQTGFEDTDLVFSTANGNAISVDDPQFGGPLKVTVASTNGVLTLSGIAGLAFSVGDGTADATMTFVGEIADINAALNGLHFSPNANFNGAATVSVTSDDQGATGSAAQSDVDSIAVTVTSVNDVPTFTLPTTSTNVNEDAGLQTNSGWATNIFAGPANENSQTVDFQITTDNDALFAVLPQIDASGVLTFTPAANANGNATVTVKLHDNGGTSSGGVDLSDGQTFTITVNAVNDVPTFTVGADQTVNEDAGPQTINGWAAGISAGPADESSQALTFDATTDNDSLFAVLPFIDASGVLTYKPALNANGSATVTVKLSDNGGTALGGVDTSGPQTFVIHVNPVNDVPSFTLPSGSTSINEDGGLQTMAGWATNLSAGPANENSQTLDFQITTDNDALFAVLPQIDSAGVLTYKPAGNANGNATVTVKLHDNGGTSNGGVNLSAAQTFTITVNPVNDVPIFMVGADQTVNEDPGLQTVNGWATGISAGPANEVGQILTFHATTDNDALFAVLPSIDASGNLSFTPASNANGFATVTVKLSDSGGTTLGGVDTSGNQTFVIHVDPVNDAPTLNPIADVQIDEDAVQQTVPISGITAGPIDEAGQTLQVTATSDNLALINVVTVQYVSGTAGTIKFTPMPNANGTAKITVTVTDNGGTTAGGVNTFSQSFTVTVNPVDDAPTTTGIADQTVLEDATTTSVPLDPSFSDIDDANSTLTFAVVGNTNPALFASISIDPLTHVLKFKPAPDVNGISNVTVRVTDTGTLFVEDTFQVTVTSVNDAPTIDPLGTLNIAEDAPEQTIDLTGISPGPIDENGQTVTITATSSDPTVVPHPTVQYTGGTTGTMKFQPLPNAHGNVIITVTVTDSGGVSETTSMLLHVGITSVNDQPVLDTTFVPLLPTVTNVKNEVIAGIPVSSLVKHVTDADTTDPKGIAVTGYDATHGHWEFRVNSGAWTPFPAVTESSALLLTADPGTDIRFMPNKASKGVKAFPKGFADLTYKAWDQSDGSTPVTPLVATTGTAFSTAIEHAWATVGKALPVLDVDGHPVLKPIALPKTAATVAKPGKPSSAYVVKSFLGLLAKETDRTKPLGIAVSGADGTAADVGVWQFNTGKGGWQTVGVVSDAQALLLRPTDKLRFVPGPTFNGHAELTYHTWDLAGNMFGTRGPATGTGFSAATETAIANAAPILTAGHLNMPSVSLSVGPTSAPVLVSALLGTAATDVEQTSLGLYVSAPKGGTWEYSLNGTNWIVVKKPVYLASTASLRFTAAAKAKVGATGSLSFKAWDQTLASPATLSKLADKITVAITA